MGGKIKGRLPAKYYHSSFLIPHSSFLIPQSSVLSLYSLWNKKILKNWRKNQPLASWPQLVPVCWVLKLPVLKKELAGQILKRTGTRLFIHPCSHIQSYWWPAVKCQFGFDATSQSKKCICINEAILSSVRCQICVRTWTLANHRLFHLMIHWIQIFMISWNPCPWGLVLLWSFEIGHK